MTYRGQWLTDIVTKHFFSKKKFVWETTDLTDIVTKVYLINIYDIYRAMTDWHCDQTFFFKKKFVWETTDLTDIVTKVYLIKHQWPIQDNDWLTLWPNIFFSKKKICMGNHWLDWHCDQGIFNKHLWIYRTMTDWHCDQTFFSKKNLYGKTFDWMWKKNCMKNVSFLLMMLTTKGFFKKECHEKPFPNMRLFIALWTYNMNPPISVGA